MASVNSGCSCSCSEKSGGSDGKTQDVSEKINAGNADAQDYKGALESYLGELKVLASKTQMKKLMDLSSDQKQTKVLFKQGLGDKNSLLDDGTGKFDSLAPLVKENKIEEIVKELYVIMRANSDNREVRAEAHRKLALCYYIMDDGFKCSAHMVKFNELMDAEVESAEKFEREALKDINDGRKQVE